MAICLMTNNLNETAERYERVMAHLAHSGPVPPDGPRLLIAGRGPDGWRAISVWEEQQSLERFFAERLAPAYAAAGVSPARTSRELFDIHTLVKPEAAGRS